MLAQLSHILQSGNALHAEIVLFLGILVLTIIQSFTKKSQQTNTLLVYITQGIVALAFFSINGSDENLPNLFNGLLEVTPLITFGKELILIATLIVLAHLRAMQYNFSAEALILMLGICFGLFFLLMSSHLLSMFVSIEMVSLCSYVLVSFNKKATNLEAGIKYLIFGATATAIMMYGASLLFGMSGSLEFKHIQKAIASGSNAMNLVQIALFMTMAGPLFKLAAAPFHIWAPDVYESTPTPFISFLAIVPKIGGLFILYKLLQLVPTDHSFALSFVILLSILVGNFAALSQKNVQRMMGYSGIAQSGFILIGMLSAGLAGLNASVFYLAVYVFLNTGAFLLIDILTKLSNSPDFDGMAGLSKRSVILSIFGLILMVGLTGIPPTAGFTAKFLVFTNLWETYTYSGENILIWVLIFGLINTAISIYYYFKIPYFMFLKSGHEKTSAALPLGKFSMALLGILAAIVIALFFNPHWIQDRL